jgi:hypothetical protein
MWSALSPFFGCSRVTGYSDITDRWSKEHMKLVTGFFWLLDRVKNRV